MNFSKYASKLKCEHCGMPNTANQWPNKGDMVPFYYQEEQGKYTLPVICPHCGKEWYVVWDEDPGPMNKC